MDGGGFEPPKQYAADLQSVPFGHSGIHPYCSLAILPGTTVITRYRKQQIILYHNIFTMSIIVIIIYN